MTTSKSPDAKVNNGVNVTALLDARGALEKAPAAAQFKWRASCEWLKGTHSRSTIGNYFGLERNSPATRRLRSRQTTRRSLQPRTMLRLRSSSFSPVLRAA